MISQVGCYLQGISPPYKAILCQSHIPEFQTFPGFSCTFPSPSIAVNFNNCCLHTHTERMSETSCHFLTHYSLLGSAQPTQGMFQFLSVPGCCLPSKPGRGGRVAGQPSGLTSIQCLLPFQSLPTMMFSSHRLCRCHICHFAGCRCTEQSSPCHQECPCLAPFILRSSCFPTLLAQSMQAAPLPVNPH